MANIVLCGVGGQGVLTLAALIGTAATFEGYDVKMSEVHGMAQRGGPVSCHVRFGVKVHSPLIIEGTADVLAALEVSESLRFVHYLKPNGTAILNSFEIPPPLALIKGVKYPGLDSVAREVLKITENLFIVNAQGIADTIGSLNVVNTAMLGAVWAKGSLGISKESLVGAIVSRFGEKWKEVNVKALEEGAKTISKYASA